MAKLANWCQVLSSYMDDLVRKAICPALRKLPSLQL